MMLYLPHMPELCDSVDPVMVFGVVIGPEAPKRVLMPILHVSGLEKRGEWV